MRSASLAAELGIPLAYSTFYRHDPPEQALKAYRESFEFERWAPEPQVILAVEAVCAATDRQARAVAFEEGDAPADGSVLVGSAAAVSKRIRALAKELEVDEVMVLTLIDDHEARMTSYRLLAEKLLG
jgi:alkanesulfonate monooxygenase SsuD/methylene tetrahydromethanopterin reductase-like flavin-dependent oxidoreductase (luciferase family)